jgi:hypothetical protein
MGGVAITLSVVSHRQNRLVNLLLADLARLQPAGLAIIATQNVDDPDPLVASGALELVRNARPRGFGENHNAALRRGAAPDLCGIRFPSWRQHSRPRRTPASRDRKSTTRKAESRTALGDSRRWGGCS